MANQPQVHEQGKDSSDRIDTQPKPGNIDFSALLPQDTERLNKLAILIALVNQAGGTYHQLDFGNGMAMQGVFDITKHLHLYNIPDSLQGKSVLDVGTASGYFALECARRGAQVTVIDIHESLLERVIPLLKVQIQFLKKNVYELDTTFGQYDLVICGSLLMHLPEPFEAIRRIRSVCRGQAIISTQCATDSATEPRPICEFLGQKASDEDYWTYWNINAPALRKMLFAAGFSQVIKENYFTLSSETSSPSFIVPHVVMTGVT